MFSLLIMNHNILFRHGLTVDCGNHYNNQEYDSRHAINQAYICVSQSVLLISIRINYCYVKFIYTRYSSF